jgi:hypothetical protein
MQKSVFVFLALLALSVPVFAGKTECGTCGGAAPSRCAGIPSMQSECTLPSASFVCRSHAEIGGWLFCPPCAQGMELEKCESSWFFGLYKTSYCVAETATACGGHCPSGFDPAERLDCALAQNQTCCDYDTNEVYITSPKTGSVFAKDRAVNFTVLSMGKTALLYLDFGDGMKAAASPGPANGSEMNFTHTYKWVGDYIVVATAHTCDGCPSDFASNHSIEIKTSYGN